MALLSNSRSHIWLWYDISMSKKYRWVFSSLQDPSSPALLWFSLEFTHSRVYFSARVSCSVVSCSFSEIATFQIYHHIISSCCFSKTALRNFCSIPSNRPSISAQLSPVVKMSTVYHLWITAAVLSLNAAISVFCAAWRAATLAILGCKSMSWAESSAEGTGTSRIDVKRDDVDG